MSSSALALSFVVTSQRLKRHIPKYTRLSNMPTPMMRRMLITICMAYPLADTDSTLTLLRMHLLLLGVSEVQHAVLAHHRLAGTPVSMRMKGGLRPRQQDSMNLCVINATRATSLTKTMMVASVTNTNNERELTFTKSTETMKTIAHFASRKSIKNQVDPMLRIDHQPQNVLIGSLSMENTS